MALTSSKIYGGACAVVFLPRGVWSSEFSRDFRVQASILVFPTRLLRGGEMHSDDVSWERGDRRSRVGGEELFWETDVVPFGGYGDRQLRCRSQMAFILPRGSGAC